MNRGKNKKCHTSVVPAGLPRHHRSPRWRWHRAAGRQLRRYVERIRSDVTTELRMLFCLKIYGTY